MSEATACRWKGWASWSPSDSKATRPERKPGDWAPPRGDHPEVAAGEEALLLAVEPHPLEVAPGAGEHDHDLVGVVREDVRQLVRVGGMGAHHAPAHEQVRLEADSCRLGLEQAEGGDALPAAHLLCQLADGRLVCGAGGLGDGGRHPPGPGAGGISGAHRLEAVRRLGCRPAQVVEAREAGVSAEARDGPRPHVAGHCQVAHGHGSHLAPVCEHVAGDCGVGGVGSLARHEREQCHREPAEYHGLTPRTLWQVPQAGPSGPRRRGRAGGT